MSSSDAQDRGTRKEDGDHGPSEADDGLAIAPCDNENGDEKRGDVVEVATGASAGAESLEKPERPAKKMKRGKYISRAWYV